MVKRAKLKNSGEATNQKNILQNPTLSLACQGLLVRLMMVDNEGAFRSARDIFCPFTIHIDVP